MKSSDFGVEESKLKEIIAVVENRLDSLQIESEGSLHLSYPQVDARVLSHKYILTCGKGLRGKVEERAGVDAVASSTTNDKEIVRNPFSPIGLGRDGPDLCVVPPRRYCGIDSSSRLDLRAIALPTSVNVFVTQDTR